MELNSKTYLFELKKYYQMYILNNERMPENHPVIRKEIYDSWKRSKKYNVDPLHIAHYQLSIIDFNKTLKKNNTLLNVAEPYVDTIYDFIRGSNYVIHITDNNGCLLRYYADDVQIKNLFNNRSMLTTGATRTERITGTDSASLCLVLDKPVQVIGAEHYLKQNHAFFCSSAPIHDVKNNLIGVLTMMGPVELYQSHSLGMTCAAAKGIEIELKNKDYIDKLSLYNKLLQSTVENYTSSIIVIDNEENIINHNSKFKKIFSLPENNYINKNLSSIFNSTSILHTTLNESVNVRDKFMTISTIFGTSVDVFVTIQTILSEDNVIPNRIIFFTEKKKAQVLVNKFSNYSATYTFESIIGISQNLKNAINLGKKAANSSSTVLILGESGTGKELFAQSIHNASDRKNMPFVTINCGAIPKNLIESELFGYENGAFTGAKKEGNPGKFELADGGTLFLDEIGDMPLELQSSLLRVLQNHEIIRVGGMIPKTIDVRIIAATNVDLLASIDNNTFRSDLYYRLNVLSIELPALRERPDDIPILARYFASTYGQALKHSPAFISDEAQEILVQYNWPGNIRELENVIERAINVMLENKILPEHLPKTLLNSQNYSKYPETSNINRVDHDTVPMRSAESAEFQQEQYGAYSNSPEVRERNELIRLMKQEHGHVQTVADLMEMPTSTLYRKLRKYNIKIKSFKRW